jgi:amidase
VAPVALHDRSLADVAASIRGGELSSLEVTRHTVERIVRLEPQLHAFAELRTEAALADAAAADARRARGDSLGALHGVPVAVKDLCAMAGTATRAGGRFSTGFAPSDTATVVTRLQEAGAIVVGKAELTEGAWGAHHPEVTPPVNPWARDRWTGSSSSGSGVCVAAGMAYGAIGTDTAGSIRFPSACNHLVGLKPTWGRVSRHGVFPLSETFDHVGPMARTVLDAALMFATIAGADPLDPTCLTAPLGDPVGAARSGTLAGVRIGVDEAYALTNLDEATAAGMRTALGHLQAAGATLVEVSLPDVASILEPAVLACFAEAAVAHAATYPSEKACYGASYAELLELGRAAPATAYASFAIRRRELRGRIVRLFEHADLLAVPVMPIQPLKVAEMAAMTAAPPLNAAPFMVYTLPFNVAGIPTLTLPLGRSPEGAPLGFQLVGPHLGEERLLSAGAAYERQAGTATLGVAP